MHGVQIEKLSHDQEQAENEEQTRIEEVLSKVQKAYFTQRGEVIRSAGL